MYPKNPNQAKVNPEFFSKKIGEKLNKLQTMEEILDESCDSIKRTLLTPDQKLKLESAHEILFSSRKFSEGALEKPQHSPKREEEEKILAKQEEENKIKE